MKTLKAHEIQAALDEANATIKTRNTQLKLACREVLRLDDHVTGLKGDIRLACAQRNDADARNIQLTQERNDAREMLTANMADLTEANGRVTRLTDDITSVLVRLANARNSRDEYAQALEEARIERNTAEARLGGQKHHLDAALARIAKLERDLAAISAVVSS